MMLLEVSYKGKTESRRIRGPVTLGTGSGADVKLEGTESSLWAYLEPSEEGLQVFDVGAPSGIFDGQSQVLEQKLRPGQEFHLGDYGIKVVKFDDQVAFIDLKKEVSGPWVPGIAVFLEGKLWKMGFGASCAELKDIGLKLRTSGDGYAVESQNALRALSSSVEVNRKQAAEFESADGSLHVLVFASPKALDTYREKQKPFALMGMFLALVGMFTFMLNHNTAITKDDVAQETEWRKEDVVTKQAKVEQPKVEVPKPEAARAPSEKAVKGAIAAAVALAALKSQVSQAAIPQKNSNVAVSGQRLAVDRNTVAVANGGSSAGNGKSVSGAIQGVLAGLGSGSGKGARASVIGGADEADVEGGLDKELIAQVIQNNINQIRHCYEQGLLRTKTLAGKVIVSFTINSGGGVAKAGVKTSSLGAPNVETCLTGQILSWKFPNPKLGRLVDVTYPFVFKSLD